MEFSYKPINPFQDDGLSKEDRAIIDAMRNTAYVCGYSGEDVEYAIHQVLKQMGRDDLLPPCEKQKVSEDLPSVSTENPNMFDEETSRKAVNKHINEYVAKSLRVRK